MKIFVIGGTGLMGSYVVNALKPRHQVLTGAPKKADIKIDIGIETSIQAAFEEIGQIDAVVMTAGNVVFQEFADMDTEKFMVGLNNKLMGQVNVVRHGLKYVKDRGSFTLISGILNVDPIRTGVSAAMVNAALEGFVKAVAFELPRGVRINLISPTVLEEALEVYAPYFPGYKSIPAKEVAQAFVKSIEGIQTGQVFYVT